MLKRSSATATVVKITAAEAALWRWRLHFIEIYCARYCSSASLKRITKKNGLTSGRLQMSPLPEPFMYDSRLICLLMPSVLCIGGFGELGELCFAFAFDVSTDDLENLSIFTDFRNYLCTVWLKSLQGFRSYDTHNICSFMALWQSTRTEQNVDSHSPMSLCSLLPCGPLLSVDNWQVVSEIVRHNCGWYWCWFLDVVDCLFIVIHIKISQEIMQRIFAILCALTVTPFIVTFAVSREYTFVYLCQRSVL